MRSFERRPDELEDITFIDYGKHSGQSIVQAVRATDRRVLRALTIKQAEIRDGSEGLENEPWTATEIAALIADLAAFGVALECVQRGDWD